MAYHNGTPFLITRKNKMAKLEKTVKVIRFDGNIEVELEILVEELEIYKEAGWTEAVEV
jgi:hypothetical protein